MATTIFESFKKRKRTPNIFTIHSLAPPGFDLHLHGPFQENIRLFLQQWSDREGYKIRNNPLWCTLFLSETNGVVFPLYTVEENVKQSPNPFCDLCRYVGWSHHFVCKRRYHLIIPEPENWTKPPNTDTLQLRNNLLHGVIHCNGFGHLISVNGSHGSSNCLCEEQIMNLFDRLCEILRTQKISVHDELMHRRMNLRLLHGVTYGCSWFCKWGYKFCHGSFGITEHKYNRAIQILRSLDLSQIIHDFRNSDRGRIVEMIIHLYMNASEIELITISDLLQFMLSLASKPKIQRKTAMALAALSPKFSTLRTHKEKTHVAKHPFESLASLAAKSNCRWKVQRIEYAAKAVFSILEEHEASTNKEAKVTRNKLREEARKQVGDTGLLDFVIKHVHKISCNNRIVHRSINPVTKLAEFSLQNFVNGDVIQTRTEPDSHILHSEPGEDIYADVLTLYQKVLLNYPESHTVSSAARAILDCKNFVKEWQYKGDEEDNFFRLNCRVLPSYNELVTQFNRPLPPAELVVAATHNATAKALKTVVQSALRDTYCVMENFVVKEIKVGELGKRGGQNQVLLSVVDVWARGCGLDLDTELRYEGGTADWTVDCSCGARDDDGVKMIACDVCHVWQHTRCNSIDDNEAVPSLFKCRACSIVLP